MDVLPNSTPDDDEARYEAALELNARLRAQAAQIPDDGAGYGPSDGGATTTRRATGRRWS